MLIRYFRINDPYRLVGLFILMILIQLPLFLDLPGLTVPELKNILLGEKLNEGNSMYTGLVDNTGPLAAWFQEFTETLFGRSLLGRHIFGFVLVFLQSAFLGIMFITRKVHNENTYIPSFIFCLLFCFSFDAITISADLIGSTFLLFALNNMFKEIEFRVQPDETVFNIGLFISLASLFSFGFSVFLVCAMLVLVFFTRSTPRKFALLAFGFLLPHFLVLSISYFNNSLGKMWEYYYLSNLGLSRDTFISFKSLLTLSAVPLAYFLISVVMLQREARFSKYQSQVLQINFLWITFALVYVLYAKNLRPQNLIIFIPAFAFLFTHFFLFIRRKKFIEINIWVLFLGTVLISYLARYQKITSVDYSKLLVSSVIPAPSGNKRILVLKNDLNLYHGKSLATPYLNWRLSEDIFRHPEYYENVTEVYHHFKADAPQEVVDPENLMAPFFQRIPELRQLYTRQGERYVRRN